MNHWLYTREIISMSRILDVHVNSLFTEWTFPNETDDSIRNSDR